MRVIIGKTLRLAACLQFLGHDALDHDVTLVVCQVRAYAWTMHQHQPLRVPRRVRTHIITKGQHGQALERASFQPIHYALAARIKG